MHKIMLSIIAPFVIVTLAFAVSTPMQAEQPPEVIVKSGDSRIVSAPSKSAVNAKAARKIVWQAWEEQLDQFGQTYLYQYIRYGNGDVESSLILQPDQSQIQSMPWEFEPQFAPVPLNITPPPCSLSVQSASVQANAATGAVHCEASALCARNGAGDIPCHGITATFYMSRLELGIWKPVAHGENSYYPGCQATVHPTFEVQCPKPGYYWVKFDGWDKQTNANLWPLSIQFQYNG